MAMFLMVGVSFAGTIQLPQTGQTKCWDTAGTEITCTDTGQDGDIQAGMAWPEPRFTTNTDTTITDALTGLVWAPNGNVMPTRDPGWDADSTADDGAVTWQHALDYVAKLNSENYLSQKDWRLPNVNELESLINASESNNASWLIAQGFTAVQATYYWSSTTDAGYLVDAWAVDMSTVYVFYSKKSAYNFVWPVRSGQCGPLDSGVACQPKTGQTKCYDTSGVEILCTGTGQDGELQAGVAWPEPRFTVNTDETVADNLTGLVWAKDGNIMPTRDPGWDADSTANDGAVTWQHALDYVAKLNSEHYLGHNDWRLPNRKELHSLTDYSKYSPALPAGHPFTDVRASYWSSTTSTTGSSYKVAWDVSMDIGSVYSYNKSSSTFCVWPVRSGQSVPAGCSTWTEVINKYTAYVNGQATWTDVINCYGEYAQ